MIPELSADCTAYTALLVIATLVLGAITASRFLGLAARGVFEPRGTYLTIALGHAHHLTRIQRIRYWKQALRYISRILRARNRWAVTGRHLQQPRIRDLVSGIARHRGTLRRESAAAIN